MFIYLLQQYSKDIYVAIDAPVMPNVEVHLQVYLFLAGIVISKNITAPEHEDESMGEYGRYPWSLAGLVNEPKRNALGTVDSLHDNKNILVSAI